MSELVNYSTIGILGAGALFALYKAFKKTPPLSSEENKNEGQVQCTTFLKRALPEEESEKKLYLAVLDQLGECFQVQFGTCISTVLTPVGNAKMPDLAIDILLVDPSDLTPKLAVLLTAGGRVWLNSGSKQLEAAKALGECGIPVISMPKQEFYRSDKLISEILDALEPPAKRKEFFEQVRESIETGA
ncbi:TPA: DUF2726 domain-containing protein [Vibrio parahaemolyticus]|uniref:DUF2726 domain-containing protein n=1 Tax=Vibrio campbellii TaxID=680 RepID=UPI001F07BCAE|nr:DUF2726 domain-containing protein [Vibrio campbellii]UMM06811.1 DUF2726 domain-containing protein [Vibrio campbellii]